MENLRINITIAGRIYPLNASAADEEVVRKVGKQIEAMIKDFEKNFDIKDKQDALAMCALRLGTNAEFAEGRSQSALEKINEKITGLAGEIDEKLIPLRD